MYSMQTEKKHTCKDLKRRFVSVIVPVFNDQSGIDAAINALAEQTWPKDSYEIIIVDNASNPQIKLNPSFGDIARILICTTPGAYAARNSGIDNAKGDIFAFTDADCLPAPDWIHTGVSALKGNKGHCIVGGEVTMTLSPKPTAVELYQYLTGFTQRENIEQRGFSVTANMFVTRSQVQSVGKFDEGLLSGGDLEWCWRAGHSGWPVVFAPEVIVTTVPRISLLKAVRQVRRVAGGRRNLLKMKAVHVNPKRVRPRRTAREAARWILSHPDVSLWNRFRMLGIASILKTVHFIERIRLTQGVSAERR